MPDKIKELDDKINTIIYNINYTNNTVGALTHYIAWKGDEPKFKKHLENLKKDDKLKENDKKDEKNKD